MYFSFLNRYAKNILNTLSPNVVIEFSIVT